MKPADPDPHQSSVRINGPHRDKTCLRSFWKSKFQTSLLSYTDWLENWNFACRKLTSSTFQKWITKALIRLHGCPGWSAPLLFANPGRQVLSFRGPNINNEVTLLDGLSSEARRDPGFLYTRFGNFTWLFFYFFKFLLKILLSQRGWGVLLSKSPLDPPLLVDIAFTNLSRKLNLSSSNLKISLTRFLSSTTADKYHPDVS